MNKLIITFTLMCLSHSLFAAGEGSKINSSSWSLLYGYSKNVNNQGYSPGGQSFKFQLGHRLDNNLEANFFVRYASQKDDITYSSVEGNIARTDLTAGLNVGYWIFSSLKLHVGYAFHSVSNTVKGNYSTSQVSTITSNYKLSDVSRKGLLAGGDLVLLKNTSFQLFTNYEYYHLNHADSHDWEAMVGIRFYPGPSQGEGMFTKIFQWIFKTGK